MKVVKFGGSSMADAGQYRKVRDILLADPDKEVHMLYDVWKEKNMYGKTVMGTVRTTYLIDENGVIMKALGKVKPGENPQDMLDLLDE